MSRPLADPEEPLRIVVVSSYLPRPGGRGFVQLMTLACGHRTWRYRSREPRGARPPRPVRCTSCWLDAIGAFRASNEPAKQEVPVDQVREVVASSLEVAGDARAVLARTAYLERELRARGASICPNPDCGLVMTAILFSGGSRCSDCGTAIPDPAAAS